MRYIAKVLKNSLHEKFPDASEDELMKVEVLESTVVTVYLYACINDSAHSACPVCPTQSPNNVLLSLSGRLLETFCTTAT